MTTMMVLLLAQTYAVQADWSGGPGVQGPVLSWGNTFWASDSVNYSNPGILSLIATSWNYSTWIKHTIDLGATNGYRGFSTFDIDGDGDKDLVLLSGDYARWYEFVSNWNYIPHDIAYIPYLSFDNRAGVWADDFDGDGDGDVVVGDCGTGSSNGRLLYFRNNGGSWTQSILSNQSRYMVFSADFDGDGDMDIVASNRSTWDVPGIWWYENDGTGNFTEHTVWLPGFDVFRIAVGDLNGDLAPDIVAVGCCGDGHAHVFINDGSGNFTQNTPSHDFDCTDGMWLNDIDVDGDLDITVATMWTSNPRRFEALLNDGTGTGWTWTALTGTAANYTDGSIARDMDLDGLPDIVGTYTNIGYFRQSLPFPTFTEYFIDNFSDSHWVYPDDLDQLSCTPDIDILASREGEHAVYENKMVAGFASLGWLESSILQLNPVPTTGGDIDYFGWGGSTCIPNDTAVAVYWRGGNTVADVLGASWNGPYFLPAGTNADSIAINTGCVRYFQYRLELRPDTLANEIATQGAVWIRYTDCPVYYDVQEDDAGVIPSEFRLRQKSGVLVLELPRTTKARLAVYDVSGRLVKVLLDKQAGPGVLVFSPALRPGVYLAVYQDPRHLRSVKLWVR